MPIRFRCEHCAGLMSIATRRAGADVPCPRCGQTVRVPFESEGEAAPPVEPLSESPSEPDPIERDVVVSPALPAAQIAPVVTGAAATVEDEDEVPVHFLRRKREEGELDMTPMVDMTFLLLIFFMVTASFSLQKTLQLPAPDPEKKGAARIQRELEEILDASVRIVVDAQNTVTINDEKVADLSGLGGVLRERMRMDAKNRTEVVLEIDPRALHGTVVQVVDACNEAGMQKIRLAGATAE